MREESYVVKAFSDLSGKTYYVNDAGMTVKWGDVYWVGNHKCHNVFDTLGEAQLALGWLVDSTIPENRRYLHIKVVGRKSGLVYDMYNWEDR